MRYPKGTRLGICFQLGWKLVLEWRLLSILLRKHEGPAVRRKHEGTDGSSHQRFCLAAELPDSEIHAAGSTSPSNSGGVRFLSHFVL